MVEKVDSAKKDKEDKEKVKKKNENVDENNVGVEN